MGRGTIETGLLRAEQHDWQIRTTDPAVTHEGEAWVRSDLAPETNQIATLRFDRGGSVVDIPIFDSAASVTNVEKVWRVQVGGVTGFIPLAANGETGAYEFLKFQHGGTALDTHDALSALPDSGVSRWTYDNEDTNSGTAIDVWGGYDGTINGATTGVTGHDGEAYSFDGTDDLVDVGDIDALTAGTMGSFSLSAWINMDTLDGSFQPIIAKELEYVLYVDDTDTTALWIHDGSSWVVINGNSPPTGSYLHVVGTFNGSNMTLYEDGSSVATGTASSTNSTANPVSHGSKGQGSNFLTGDIDDPRVYDKELSSTEVSNLYSTGSISG